MQESPPFKTEPVKIEANLFRHHPDYISGLLGSLDSEILTYQGAGVFNKIVEIAGFLQASFPLVFHLRLFWANLFLRHGSFVRRV